MKAWYDDVDSATLQRIKAYSAFNDATSKNLMIQTMYEYREKEIKDFKETNHELAELCIQRKKENEELKEKLAGAERTRDNLVQLGFPTFQSCKKYANKLTEAKRIIKMVAMINKGIYTEDGIKAIYAEAEKFLEGFKWTLAER